MRLFDLPGGVLWLIIDRLDSIDLQCLRLSCTTARHWVDYYWKPLRGHTAALEVPLDEDHVQRVQYALCRGLSPDLLVGKLDIMSLEDGMPQVLQGGLYQFKRLRLVPPEPIRELPGRHEFLHLLKFKAHFPDTLAQFTALTNLTLNNIPVSCDWPITRLTTLRELRIENVNAVVPDGTWWLPELTSLTVEGQSTLELNTDGITGTCKLQRLRLLCNDDDFVLPDDSPTDSLWGLRELSHLDCHVQLNGIPDGFSQLTGLIFLKVSPDAALPAHFSCLTNLQSLHIDPVPRGGIFTIEPGSVGTISSLQKLELSQINLTDLAFCDLTRLTALTLLRCYGGLHPSICELGRLQSLHIADHYESLSLPQQISCLSALTNLHISNERDVPGEIPITLYWLRSLRRLELDLHQSFVNLPDELEQLQQLQYLHVVGRQAVLRHSMTNLSQLTKIVLSATRFHNYPMTLPSLSKLPRLREVSVTVLPAPGYLTFVNSGWWSSLLSGATQVTSLTLESEGPFLDALPTLTNLRELHLRHDDDDGLGEQQLEKITSLTKLTSFGFHRPYGPIPDFVFDLVRLRTLHIIGTTDRKLPTSISKLQSLQCLIIPKGLQLCRSVTRLKRLVRLNVVGGNEHMEALTGLARARVIVTTQE